MDDHLSIYLDVADSANLPNGWSRFAQFSLAVLNQTHNYLWKKETVHQFTARDYDWGFTQFMPLRELNDPHRGYIVDDTCTVEAEVAFWMILGSSTNELKAETGLHTLMQDPLVGVSTSSRIIWRIESFSKLDADVYYSDIFLVDGWKWRLGIYRREDNTDQLSVYLHSEDLAKLPYAKFSLAIVNQLNNKHIVRHGEEHQFNAVDTDWGSNSVISLSELNDPLGGYIVNDTCIIEVAVSARKMTENSKYDSKKTLSTGAELQTKLTEKLPGPALTTQSGLQLMDNSPVEVSPSSKFIWRIENFSKLDAKKYHFSDFFLAGGCKWRVIINFQKEEDNVMNHLWVYLFSEYTTKLPSEDTTKLPYAEFILAVVNQINNKDTVRKYGKKQFNAEDAWGCKLLNSLSKLNDPLGGYIVNDTCIIEVEISACRVMENLRYDSKQALSSKSADAQLNAVSELDPEKQTKLVDEQVRECALTTQLLGEITTLPAEYPGTSQLFEEGQQHRQGTLGRVSRWLQERVGDVKKDFYGYQKLKTT